MNEDEPAVGDGGKLGESSASVIRHKLGNEGDTRAILALTGTNNQDLATLFINQVCNATWATEEERLLIGNASLVLLQGINPRDELEAMLGVQMVGVHNMAMECLRRSIESLEYDGQADENIDRANRLLRTFTGMVDSLNRYREKGWEKLPADDRGHESPGG